MLEHIGEIARVKFVSVIHDAKVLTARRRSGSPPRRNVDALAAASGARHLRTGDEIA